MSINMKCASCGWSGSEEDLTWVNEDTENYEYCPNCFSGSVYEVKKKFKRKHKMKASVVLEMLGETE